MEEIVKMRIYKLGILSIFKWLRGITLAPFGIFIREGYLTDRIINHEMIHWKQQMEMFIIPFYLWYIFEWIIRLPINGKDAYMKLLFEQEAHNNDDNLDYLKTRKHFSWIKYL